MKVSLLGTNGWFDTHTGRTPCVVIRSENIQIVLDAGFGFSRLDRYVDQDKPVYLFLSHFHLDHIIGLHVLPKYRFTHGLRIYGQVGLTNMIHSFLRDPFTMDFNALPYSVEFVELSDSPVNLPFSMTALPLIHASPCLGYRFEVDGKIVTYCTDTGYCENAVTLAKDADLLVSECTFPSGKADPGWPHLTPESAAQIAQEAGSKKMVMTHFDPTVYRDLEHRKIAERNARAIFPNSFAGADEMEIEL